MSKDNQTSSSFLEAVQKSDRDTGMPVDWITGPVNAVLFQNGTVDVYPGKISEGFTVNLHSGVASHGNTTTSLTWSNSDASPFFRRADQIAAFGEESLSDRMRINSTRSATLLRIGESALVIQNLDEKGNVGFGLLHEKIGLRTGDLQTRPSAPAINQGVDRDFSPLTHSVM